MARDMNRFRTYAVWHDMLRRCYNKKDKDYHRYGGRGIKVCKRWRSFKNFLNDFDGGIPIGLTIERIRTNGMYKPSNCRLATRAEQQRNTCKNVFFEKDGQRLCLTDWSKKSGLSRATISSRLRSGWPRELAFTSPPWTWRKQ